MADKKNKKNWKQLLDKHAETKGITKLGDYKESTGGGTPMAKGQKIDYVADNAKEAQAYRKEHPDALVRVNQPRDEEGHFTYNSANLRGVEYPSRGKTIPPFLRGVELAFGIKSGQGSIVMGGKKYKPLVAFKTKSEFVKMFTEYSEKDDTFVGKLGMSFGAMTETAKGMGGKIGKTTTLKAGALISEIKSIAKTKGHDLKDDHIAFANPSKSAKVAAPTQPIEKPETKPAENVGITTTKKGEVDYSLAKTNKEKFVEDNATEINDLVQLADKKGFDVDIDELVESIATGEFKNFDDIRNALKGIE